MPGSGALRLLRVLAFAASAVGLASAAHALAAGQVPVPVALFAVPVLAVVLHPLAGRRRGQGAVLVAMGATQLALHATFMLWTASDACRPLTSGHVHAAAMSCDMVMARPAGALPDGVMTLTHVLAAALLAALLTGGEAALWTLAALPTRARMLLAVVLAGPVVVPTSGTHDVVVARRARPAPTPTRREHPRRGPPSCCAA